MVVNPQFAKFDIGRVIERTLFTLGGNLVSFFLLGLLFAGVPTVLMQYAIQQIAMSGWAAGWDPSMIAFYPVIIGIGSFLLLLLPAYILIGAVTHGTVVFLNDGRAGFVECLATGLKRMLPLVALGLVSTLAIGLGMLLLIIPGVILAVRWAVAAPALVAERVSIMDALGRSAELGSNNRWRIFWLAVVWFVLNGMLELAFTSLMGLMGGALLEFGESAIWVYLGIFGIYASISAMIPAAGAAALYSELRRIKEGASTQDLARLFD